MKIYLYLCVTLTLAYRGFARIVVQSTESNLNSSVENTLMSITESTFNSVETTQLPITESTFNSVKSTVIPNMESTLNSTENPSMSNEDSSLTSSEEISASMSKLLNCSENKEPWEVWVSEKSVWKCLCELPFLPYPMNDTCVKDFRQGPCGPGNMVIQPQPTFENVGLEPRCIPNPCHEDGLVFFNGTCRDITKNWICDSGVPYYNIAASEIRCAYWRPLSAITAPTRSLCPPDSRPDRNGICRKKM